MVAPTNSSPEYQALVVENELDFRSELIYLVESLDFGISVSCEASNFASAKALLDDGDIDLLITDINLTDSPRFEVGRGDGLELAAYARDRYDIPTIFLTAFADFDPAVIAKATACDPIGFIQKQADEIGSQTRDHINLAMRRLDQLREARECKRQLLDLSAHIGGAKLFVDENGVIFDSNQECLDLLEGTEDTISNHRWEDVLVLSPLETTENHPLIAAIESGEQRFLPSVALELPNEGLLLVSVLITPSEHQRRPCSLVMLRELRDSPMGLSEWKLIAGNCLVLISASYATTDMELDLRANQQTMMRELQSTVLARFRSSLSVTIINPGTLVVVLGNTQEDDAYHLISTLLLKMEKLLSKRHAGLLLHASVGGIKDSQSARDVITGAMDALVKAQSHPTRRVQRVL